MPTNATYIPFFVDLPAHKQTLKLRGRLEALGMPEKWSPLCFAFVKRLNAWCMEHNGGSADISELPPRQIAEVCGWPDARSADAFVEAMVDAGFIDQHLGEREGEGRFVVHNLEEYLKPVLGARERSRRYRDAKRDASRDAKQGAARDGNALKEKKSKEKISKTGNGSSSKSPAKTAAEPVTDYGNGDGKKPAPAAPGGDLESERPTATATAGLRNQDSGGSGGAAGAAPLVPGGAAEPATGHAPAPVPKAAGEGSAEAERMRRWTIFAEVLRRWGLKEPSVRRLLHWIGTRAGGRSRDLDVNFAWNVLGTIKGIEGLGEDTRKASFEKMGVKDGVAYLIGIFNAKPGFIPNEDNLKLARRGWEATEAELAAKDGVQAPAWLVMFLTGVGK